jgi:hypothetical protein
MNSDGKPIQYAVVKRVLPDYRVLLRGYQVKYYMRVRVKASGPCGKGIQQARISPI